MPSRKQRRKREKLQRHEYEYVLEDEDGELQSAERLSELDVPKAPRPAKEGSKNGELVDRRGRKIPKPSLERVLRRGAIFAPLVFLFVYATDKGSLTANLFSTAIILGFLLPFMFLVDSVVYRMAERRHAKS
jgi:hypothetical protein